LKSFGEKPIARRGGGGGGGGVLMNKNINATINSTGINKPPLEDWFLRVLGPWKLRR